MRRSAAAYVSESAMRISINKAISYLWNLKFWSFRKYTQKLKTRAGREHYKKPDGIIEKKTVSGSGITRYSVKYGRKFLDYEKDYELLEDKTGEPGAFYLKNETICFYPVPDSDYNINIGCFLLPYGLNSREEQIYELKEDDDYINIPERYETLFKNCLISFLKLFSLKPVIHIASASVHYGFRKPGFTRTQFRPAMIYAIADDSDENHSGYQRQYENSLKTFLL